LEAILSGAGPNQKTWAEFLIANLPPCIEDGNTFEENARRKALHYSAYVSGPVFADDSDRKSVV
jgi:inosine/xanthosine triphosphate pyrophosphatase family protein